MKQIKNYSIVPESNKKQKIRILLVDDRPFVRRFIRNSLEEYEDLRIIGIADNGHQAIERVEKLNPDIVLMDLEMPEMDGITATEIITKKNPDCQIIVITSHESQDQIQKALKAGAKGYLLKGTSGKELTNAIYSVDRGYTQLSPGLIEKVLTPEIEIVPSVSQETTLQTIPEDNWSESTREAINTLPKISLRALLYALLLLLMGIIPWALFSKVDEVGKAKGRLEPQGRVINLESAVSGTVISIDTEEGEKVRQGETLLKLESEIVNSQLQQQQQKLEAQQNQLDRLELLKNQQLLSVRTLQQQNNAQQFEKETLIDRARQNVKTLQATYQDRLSEKKAQLEQAEEAIEAKISAHKIAEIRYKSAKEKVPRYRQAYQQGALSLDVLSEAEREANESRESLTQTESEIIQARSFYTEQQKSYARLNRQINAEIEQAQLRLQEQQRGLNSLIKGNNLATVKSKEESKNTAGQIAIIKGEIAQTKSIIKSLEYQLQQRIVYAPIEGTVFQLPIKKPGAVVTTGQMVAQISPKDSPLIVRAKLNSKDSGFLKKGLPVKLKFDAYPFQDYGIVEGTLTWISPDSRQANNSSDTFYEIEIELKQNYLQKNNQKIFLSPGQTATVEIIIRQLRLVDIILKPFKTIQKGGIKI